MAATACGSRRAEDARRPSGSRGRSPPTMWRAEESEQLTSPVTPAMSGSQAVSAEKGRGTAAGSVRATKSSDSLDEWTQAASCGHARWHASQERDRRTRMRAGRLLNSGSTRPLRVSSQSHRGVRTVRRPRSARRDRGRRPNVPPPGRDRDLDASGGEVELARARGRGHRSRALRPDRDSRSRGSRADAWSGHDGRVIGR